MESKINEIEINGIKYVQKDSVQLKQPSGPIKILILQRGWVMVGRFERNGNDCKLHDAAVIRTWGTTEGLGEIAMGGPTQSTKLDKCGGLVEFDYLTVVAAVSCEESKWKSVI